MQLKNLIAEYLSRPKTLQLATCVGDRPWVCTVYFVADKDLNLFWLSWPSRRHSQELNKNPKAAIAIQLKTDLPVIGIQGEGVVEAVNKQDIVKSVMKEYVNKYGSGKDFYNRFVNGINKHRLFKFTPQKYVLFDEVHFPENPRTELQI